MKFIKKIIGLVLALLIIILITLTVLVFVVDFNEYKPLITDQVEQATGRKLTIEGDIKLAVWPWLGVQVVDARLSNAPGFGAQPFASVAQFDLKLELLPLLQSRINVDKILLHGLVLSLAKNSQGENNWDDLNKTRETKAQVVDSETGDQSGTVLGAVSIQGIEVKNGQLNWLDEQSQTQAKLDDVQLETGAISVAKAIPVRFSAHAQLNEPQMDLNINLDTRISLDVQSMTMLMEQVEMELRILTPELTTQNTLIKLTAALKADLNQQQYKINNLELNLNTRGYQLPGSELDLQLKASVTVDLQQKTASLENINVLSTGISLNASANIKALDTEPVVDGQLNLQPFNPVEIANKYKINLPSMADSQALHKMHGKLDFKATANTLEIRDMVATVDDSTVSGHVSVKNFSQPELKYDVKLNAIKLDRYLPAVKNITKTKANREVGFSDAPIDLPLKSLRSLNINGVFRANKIDWLNYQLTDLYIKTAGDKGLVVINPVNVRVFDGRVALAAKLDVRTKQPKYTVNIKAENLQLASAAQPVLLKLLNEDNASLEGVVDFNAQLNTEGNSVHELVSELDGKMDFRTGKTQLKNIDIEYYLRQKVWYVLDQKIRKANRQSVATLKKHNFPTTEKDFMHDYKPKDKTAFNVIRARASISQGVVNNYEFVMASDRVNITGNGAIYLPNQRINYVAKIDLHRTHNSLQDEILDIPLTINLNGPFASLKPQPDVNAWLSKAWDVMVAEGKQATKEKVKQKAEDKLKDMLKQWQF